MKDYCSYSMIKKLNDIISIERSETTMVIILNHAMCHPMPHKIQVIGVRNIIPYPIKRILFSV